MTTSTGTAFVPMSAIVLTRGNGELFLGGRVGGPRAGSSPRAGSPRRAGGRCAVPGIDEEIGLGAGMSRCSARLAGGCAIAFPGNTCAIAASARSQRWFLLKLTADEAKFRFDTTDQPEFDRWRWVDFWAPVREVVYFKRRVYARALQRPWQADIHRRPAALSGMVGGAQHPGRESQGGLIRGRREIQGLTTARTDDGDQQERRKLVEHAIPPGGAHVRSCANALVNL